MSKTIKVDYLARVEGEGALYIRIKDDTVTKVQLKIFEPPRFFEAFLQGRKFTEAPDITARICGICPVAYQMSSVHAMEQILGLRVAGPLRDLRRLIYCGEWIESHGLHVYMLHAPDFLGYADAIEMARDHPGMVEQGLKIKKIGNELVALVGGREVHPINVRVGGFYRVPHKKELAALTDRLKWARDAALETVRWVGSFDFPPLEQDYEFVSLRHPQEYPFNEGRLVSNKRLDIAVSDFETHFEEEHVPYTNALHAVIKGRGAYYVGPMARYNNNFDLLPPAVQSAAREAGLSACCRNPFQSIIVRSVEILYACEEALRIIDQYEMPDRPYLEIKPRAGVGHGISEAPRGSLYHRYHIDDRGVILDAKIVPPTSQNQKTIESDLYQVAVQNLDLSEDQLTWLCEQTIRNYDPCISCSVHFLKIHLERD
ncbi:MAG: Ni/Fe hydrogenase subunit alpha [Deltaproteobacteria bacterium]|nr:Ni/Fe hydrogenase subunit alpha [Deltaproteobacteria bacterium]MBW1951762.1 Ni/Fe hydrogenase subunit alpha [Deltaproteobacteria bacterium]MBW1986842.1 Ni/Fe hydrogenase subunit alpha [Deltaproteobacteria bacterium]MBW2134966.1 Ni/Fe hydrogenase subunit alpha [Deltaproteobacteria bacterium]